MKDYYDLALLSRIYPFEGEHLVKRDEVLLRLGGSSNALLSLVAIAIMILKE